MKIETTAKNLTIEVGSDTHTKSLGEVTASYNANLDSLTLKADYMPTLTAPLAQVTVNGVQMDASNINTLLLEVFKSPTGGGTVGGDTITSFTRHRSTDADGVNQTDTFLITTDKNIAGFETTLPVVNGFTMLPEGVNLDLIVDEGEYIYKDAGVRRLLMVIKNTSNAVIQTRFNVRNWVGSSYRFIADGATVWSSWSYGLGTSLTTNDIGTPAASILTYQLNQMITALQSAVSESVSYVDYITLPKVFKKLTSASTAVPTTEFIIPDLTHTIAEDGNYKGILQLNVLRVSGSSTRYLTVKLMVNGTVAENGLREMAIPGDGLKHFLEMTFVSETPLPAGSVLTVSVQANNTGLQLVSGTGYIAARSIIEKVY